MSSVPVKASSGCCNERRPTKHPALTIEAGKRGSMLNPSSCLITLGSSGEDTASAIDRAVTFGDSMDSDVMRLLQELSAFMRSETSVRSIYDGSMRGLNLLGILCAIVPILHNFTIWAICQIVQCLHQTYSFSERFSPDAIVTTDQ